MEVTNAKKRVEIFCCYARQDQPLLITLKKHLKLWERQSLITLWTDTDISPGTNWEKEIARHLNSAHLILFLVSPDFLASEYCYSTEMVHAMERYEHGEVRIIPIILRYCAWEEAPFGKMQALPTNVRPVVGPEWHNPDEAFTDVAEGIRKAVIELQSKSAGEKKDDMRAGGPLRPTSVLRLLHTTVSRRTILFLSLAVASASVTGIGWLELTHHFPINQTTPSAQPGQTTMETPPGTDNSAQINVSAIAWSPDGHFIASGSDDSTVWVRNVITRKIAIKKQQPAEVQSVAWSPDGTKIASGDQDGSLQVWDSATGLLIANAGGTSSPQQMSISWSPDSKKIVATGANVWDATTGKLIFTYPAAETDCPVAWSPDGKSVASGSHTTGAFGGNAGVDVWNATTGEFIFQYVNGSQEIGTQAVAWSPDGKFIAASYTSGTVVDVWNTTTGELITQYKYQTIIENVLAWSPDSKKIASLALDGVEIWDPVTGKPISTIQGSYGATCVAWSPDGTKIASGSSSGGIGTVQISQAP